jgi:hypothetical protein
MFIVGILGWWYSTGWKQRLMTLRERVASTADYFSIDLLLKTLFSPYRQISAGKVQGSINVQLHAFFDQMISRIIGAIVRSFMIIFGIVSILAYVLIGGVLVILWGVIPLLPVVGLVLFLIGWMPWKM